MEMDEDKKKLVKKILASSDGTSIVSVISAFVLLLMGISMFYAAILASQRMLDKAEQMNLASQQALQHFYEEGAAAGQEAGSESESTAITLREIGGNARISVQIPSAMSFQ